MIQAKKQNTDFFYLVPPPPPPSTYVKILNSILPRKVLFSFISFFFLISLAWAETGGFNLNIDRYNLSFTPKILEDGIQNDFSFGLFYSNEKKMAGEIRMKHTRGAANDTVWDIEDSLMTRDQQVYEFFLLPLNYHFLRTSGFSMRAGGGLYYEYNKLNENGFFNDSVFYNAYANDHTASAIGPLFDLGISYRGSFFSSTLSFGLVPVFNLNRKQTWKLSPMMNPNPLYSVASQSRCGPYTYLYWDSIFNFNYFSLFFSFLNNRSNLNYTAAGFNDLTGDWADIKEEIKYKARAIEISILIHLKESYFHPQIGYGRIFNEVTGGGNYLLFGVKKTWF
ncbi:MAG: hypothetical protein LBC80_07825 [Treponema sp.]|jgi:hypothetical protein|nr:hypothetical protein [Treponema sp.]